MRRFDAIRQSNDTRLFAAGDRAWSKGTDLATSAVVHRARALRGAILLDPNQLLSVTDVLRRRGILDKVGGAVSLAELTESAFTTTNTTHHARIIRDKALYRSLINIATDIGTSAQQQEDLPEILGRAHDALLRVAGAQQTSGFASMDTIMRQAIHQAHHAESHELTGVHTGFHELNRLTSGFQPGNLIIVAARPSQGKSALDMQFALAAAHTLQGLPVTFFSLEMSRDDLGLRVLCSEARVQSTRMKRGLLEQDEWGRLMDTGNHLEELPLLIDDTASLSVLDVRTRAKRLQMERGLGFVVITEPHKRCSRCQAHKPLKEFSQDRRRKDGRASQCKHCDTRRLKKYYDNVRSKSEAFRQRNRAKAKAYYQLHPEHVRTYKAEYYQAHKETLSIARQTYYQEHKDSWFAHL